jgi:hypothetical protein
MGEPIERTGTHPSFVTAELRGLRVGEKTETQHGLGDCAIKQEDSGA